MLTKTQAVDGAAIKKAIEGRDGKMLSSFYADDAQVRVIDRNNPPSKPREIHGRAAISTLWDDICSRTMTHKVDNTIAKATVSPTPKPAPIRTARKYSPPRCLS
jgi:ketosteroid isomerase-like protein